MRTCIRFAALAVVTAMLLLASLPVNAASPAEALEKGIYNEETTGNLDEAIKHYRQVLADAQKTEGLAAQAQYRLGRCLHKQGKKKDAAEAFKTLIRKYPDQKELVAKAKKMLPGRLELLPAPWKPSERATLTMMLPGGRTIGIIGMSVTAGKRDGKAVWEMDVRRYVTGGGNSGISSAVIDQKTNLPVATRWDHTLLGSATANWSADKVVITTKGKDGKDETKTVQLEAPAYCNDQWMFCLRQLPLKMGYKVTVPIRVAFTGGNGIGMEVDVTMKEKVETPVGTFDCFKVETNIAQTFWITDTPERYVAKMVGGGVEILLTSVDGGKAVKLSNDKLNFSVTKPAGWYHYADTSQNDSTSGGFRFVAPSEFLAVSLSVKKKTLLSSEERESPDAWADSLVQTAKDALKGASVVADSRKATQLAGQNGVTFVLNYESSGRKRRSSPTLAFKGDMSVQLDVVGDVKPFDEHQKSYGAILKSVTLE